MKEAFTATDDNIEGALASEARVPVATDPSAVDETVLQPSRGWRSIGFRELRGYRELLYFLTWRDIKVRYKQTVLGAIWAILQPVISMIIFSIIFGKFAKIPSNGVPYPIFVYAGLLPWTFFSNAVSRSGMSLVTSVNLLTKIYFPRLLIPTASVGAALVDFALSFLVYVGIMLWYMHLPGLSVLLLPGLVLLTIMTALGTGYVLTSLAVVYRDFRIVIPFMIQVWMWASPVVYPVTLLPDQFRWVMALNPMSGIIGGYRSVLLNQPMDWSSLGVSTLVASVIFVYGIFNFRRAERRFADIA
jgi:lipopolysaccharide transport system permease protein